MKQKETNWDQKEVLFGKALKDSRDMIEGMRKEYSDSQTNWNTTREELIQEIDSIRKQSAESQRDLIKNHEGELDDQKKVYESTVTGITNQLNEYIKGLEIHRSLHQEATNKLNKINEDFEKEKSKNEEFVKHLTDEIFKLRENNEILVDEHTKNISTRDERIFQLEGQLKNLELMWQSELQETVNRFERRLKEGRPEDLELIARLQHEIIERNRLVARLSDELELVRRELINREDSYNKNSIDLRPSD